MNMMNLVGRDAIHAKSLAVGLGFLAVTIGINTIAAGDVVILNDKFLDLSLAATGSPGEIDTAWYSYNNNAGGVAWAASNNGIGAVDGFGLAQVSGSGVDTVAFGSFSETALAGTGDWIALKFDAIFYPGQNPSVSGIEFYLLDDQGSPMVADVIANDPSNTLDPRTTNSMVASSMIGTDDLIPLRTGMTPIEYRLELQADSSLKRTVSVNSLMVVDDVISAPATLTFNQVGVLSAAYSGTGYTVLDNIQISTNVPEPASVAFVSLGLAAILMRTRGNEA